MIADGPGMPASAPASGYEQGVEAAIRLLECLLTNDPDDFAADGITVLDVWRKDAERALPKLRALSSAPAEPELPAEVAAAVKLAADILEPCQKEEPDYRVRQPLEDCGLYETIDCFDPGPGHYQIGALTPLGRALLERAGSLG